MRQIVIALGLGILLLLAVFAGISAWMDLGEVDISPIGWLAMAGGILLSLLVGGGLMALVFHSSRSGHDQRSQQDQRSGDPPL